MKKLIIFCLILFVVPLVSAGIFDVKIPKINIPSYEQPSPQIPYPQQPQAAPQFRQECTLGETRCDERNFMRCMSDGLGNILWFTVNVCGNDQFCRVGEGCVAAVNPPEEQIAQPVEEPQQQDIRQALNVRLPAGLIEQIEQEQHQEVLPPIICNLGDITCSGDQRNILTCRNNQWQIQERCSSTEECVIGRGCIQIEIEAEQQELQPEYPDSYERSYYDREREKSQTLIFTKEEKLTKVEKELLDMLIEEREKNLQLQKEIKSLKKQQKPTEEKPTAEVKEGFFSRIWKFVKNIFS